MRVTVIGAGNMGGALVRGWMRSASDMELTVTSKTKATLDRIKADLTRLTATLDNRKAVNGADVVVLAVKPWIVDNVLGELGDTLAEDTAVVCVAAGVRHRRIDVYAMPNIAAELGKSMTFIEEAPAGDACRERRVETACKLFALVGEVQVVDSKRMIAGMMMAGCGIAYVMRFLRAMTEGGVEMGFYPEDAKEVAMQTMMGAVTLLKETGLHPEEAIDKVTTPGGVTIKGLNELDHAGFSSAVIRCLKAGLK